MSQDKIESRRAFMKKVAALSGVVAFMTPVMASEEKNNDAKEPEGGCKGTCRVQCDSCTGTCEGLCAVECTSCTHTCKWTCTKTSF